MTKGKKEKVCIREDKLGNCLEYIEVGDRIEVRFKEKAKECNPKLYKEYEKKFLERKIDVRL